MVEVGGVFNLERLTVKEWQRERGTTKKQMKRSWRSGTSKSHPKKYPEWREAERRVVCVVWYFGPLVFSCRALYPYFLQKKGRIAERRPRLRPPPPFRYRKADPI